MEDQFIHKILAPARVKPVYLKELILCADNERPVVFVDSQVSKSIRKVTCPRCLELWKNGNYE